MLIKRIKNDIKVVIEKVQTIEAIILQIKTGDLELDNINYNQIDWRIEDILCRLGDLLNDLYDY